MTVASQNALIHAGERLATALHLQPAAASQYRYRLLELRATLRPRQVDRLITLLDLVADLAAGGRDE